MEPATLEIVYKYWALPVLLKAVEKCVSMPSTRPDAFLLPCIYILRNGIWVILSVDKPVFARDLFVAQGAGSRCHSVSSLT